MRADRLIAELMLLQTNGKMSAAVLAKEMEVSPRTIYRDMLALNTAGIPIYADNGSNGGYQLVDGYRTQLTGFSTQELQALFAMNIPAILGDLGMDETAKTAMRKLQASLSQQQNQNSGFMSQRFLYDPTRWESAEKKPLAASVMGSIQQAIWQDQLLHITIQYWHRPEKTTLQIAPYALAIKENQRYLIYERHGSFRAQHLTNIIQVLLTEEQFERQADFNLAQFWQTWCEQQKAQKNHYAVELLLKKSAYKAFTNYHAANIEEVHPQNDIWLRMVCKFDRLEEARGKLMQWGGAIIIRSPEALRLTMIDYAQQMIHQNNM